MHMYIFSQTLLEFELLLHVELALLETVMLGKRSLIRVSIVIILFFLITFWLLNMLQTNETSHFEHRLAVIVPFRNRSLELIDFVRHMSNFLTYQSINYRLYFIHQVDRHRFNRAALINIGYLESRSWADYLVMHDVDLLPLNRDELLYRYPSNGPIHLASPQYHPIYHYQKYVGGILMITCHDFERVNGMSPLYWGWGTEDDNFFVRIKLAQLKLFRPHNLSTNQTNTFLHSHQRTVHQRDTARYGNQTNEGKNLRPELGFNTTNYRIVEKRVEYIDNQLPYTMIDVEIECNYDLTPWCDHPTRKTL